MPESIERIAGDQAGMPVEQQALIITPNLYFIEGILSGETKLMRNQRLRRESLFMPNRVTVDKNRTVRVNGEPFFLIGARHMPEGGSPRILSDAGFNAFRAMAFGSETAEPDPLPDEKDNILFWSYIFDRTVFSRSPDYETVLKEHILHIKDHPALLCYENFNEPAKMSHWQPEKNRAKAEPADILEGTRLIRELDPDHPIWMAHNFQRMAETLARYNPCADIIGSNCYPVMPDGGIRRYMTVRNDGRMIDCPEPTIHAVGKYTDKMMRVCGGKMPVWMLLQGMANASWLIPDNTPIPEERVLDTSKFRYPSRGELRFMVYDALISGATGFALSMYKTHVGSEAWDDIANVIGEIRDMVPVLTGTPVDAACDITYEDIGYTIWDGVILTARQSRSEGGDLWLLAANTAFDPARITLQMKDRQTVSRVQVQYEGREIPVENGSFSDSFDPYGVHIYRITYRD